jgi:hypothetical protein
MGAGREDEAKDANAAGAQYAGTFYMRASYHIN